LVSSIQHAHFVKGEANGGKTMEESEIVVVKEAMGNPTKYSGNPSDDLKKLQGIAPYVGKGSR
jgi:hypothetical protein